MADRELVFGAHVDNRDQIVTQSGEQVITGYRFERIARRK
jgi:hypothetical protein